MSTVARKLDPSSVGLHNNDELFNNLPAAFKRLKDGAKILPNSFFDRLLMKDAGGDFPSKERSKQLSENFLSLPIPVQRELIRNWVVTSTLMVKNKDGEMLGDKIVFSDGTYSITFIVNKNFQREYGIVADLIPENFHLEMSADMKHITISELREADTKPVVFPYGEAHYVANDSTLWVPSTSIPLAESLERRRFRKFPDSENKDYPFVALAARRFIIEHENMEFITRDRGGKYEDVANIIYALQLSKPFILLEDVSQNVNADKIWKPCTKNAVVLQYREVIGDKETIHTWEGALTAYRDRDYIVKGLKGEEYPVEKSLFAQLYWVGDNKEKF